MEITVNGEKKSFVSEISLPDLLKSFDLKKERVVVELNLNIVKKDSYESTVIKDGDNLELVHFVGGG